MHRRLGARDDAALAAMVFVGLLVACAPDQATEPITQSPRGATFSEHTLLNKSVMFPLRLNELRTLHFLTYDGGNETVHPDHVAVDQEGLSGKFLVLTPYKGGNAAIENPTIYTSSGAQDWRVPVDAPNPLAISDELHLSDPDIVYDPARRELMVYYREVGEVNSILMIHSTDAVHWSAHQTLFAAPNHEIVSPTVVRKSASEWLMWTVNAHSGCSDATSDVELRRSEDGLTWSGPEPVLLSQSGYTPWHIDVQWIPSLSEYWAVYNVKTNSSCTTPALYLATSPDGVHWQTYPSPVLVRGATPALADIVYRSTFAFDAATDVVTFWYSGARYAHTTSAYVWSTVVQRRTRAELFARLAVPSHAALMGPATDVPPLRDPP